MTDRQVEQRLKAALEAAAPNDFDSVLSQCTQRKGNVIQMKAANNSKKLWAIGAAAAACFMLVVGAGVLSYQGSNQITSLVSLDVNPSVQLDLNKKDRVVNASAQNEDAVAIMDGMDLKGVQADVAVNALIGSMVKNGYVSGDANSVLISVQSDNPDDAAKLRVKLGEAASQSMESLNGSVISQVVTQDSALAEKASQYGISQGKAQFIEQLIETDERLSFEDLASAPVNDLNLIAASKSATGAAQTSGTASDGRYIGKEAAQKAALAHVGLQTAEIYHTEFDRDDGRMVYEVEFVSGGVKYDVDVDAATGAVVSTEQERLPGTVPSPNPNPNPAQQPSSLISREQALSAAMAHVGVTDAQNQRIDLEEDHGSIVYDIEFVSNGIKYEIDVDARSSAILSSGQKVLAGGQTPNQQPSGLITREQAISAAMAHVGVTDAQNQWASLEEENGSVIYDVEFVSGGIKYELDVDAKTSAILSSSQKVLAGGGTGVVPSAAPIPSTAPVPTTAPIPTAAPIPSAAPGISISKEQALQIAMSHAGVSGAENQTAHLDRENGRTVYEIDFVSGGQKYEYDVDASNGAILKSSKEAAERDDYVPDLDDAFDDDDFDDDFDDFDD